MAQSTNARIVEDGALVRAGPQLEAAHLVVGAELQAIDAGRKVNVGMFAFAAQRLPRCEAHRWGVGQAPTNRDLTHTRGLGRGDQFLCCGDGPFLSIHGDRSVVLRGLV